MPDVLPKPPFPPAPHILPLLISSNVSKDLKVDGRKYIASPVVFLPAPVRGKRVVSDVVPPTVTPLLTIIVTAI